MITFMFILRLIILFLVIYAIIKNLKTLLKAGVIVLIVLILLGLIGY
ncbi:hypothetical protein [Methanobrevibacter sp.]|nr:hypothetical protein [Methanobrevibacter sp.]MBR4448567.1 hypothetical protein [Methanobrevibacter sp.]